jgi:hypothetical protein
VPSSSASTGQKDRQHNCFPSALNSLLTKCEGPSLSREAERRLEGGRFGTIQRGKLQVGAPDRAELLEAKLKNKGRRPK